MIEKKINPFQILKKFEDTQHYLEIVRKTADNHRREFGFLAEKVYTEFASKGALHILVTNQLDMIEYVGHLMFSQSYPKAKIIQMCIDPKFRRKGAASILIEEFKSELTDAGFTSIYASVAQDLIEANVFWEQQLFFVQRIREGGESRKRVINHRCHELDTPQLFPKSGLSKDNPLGLKSDISGNDQLFLIDLNVVFDLTQPRRVRHSKAVNLFQAERTNLCKLAISDELRKELKETATLGRTDQMEGFIDIFPEVPLRKFDPSEQLLKDLQSLVFPQKKELSRNDQSDIRHIATAIQYSLAGLITNDETVLSSSSSIKVKYGIEIISPDAFIVTNCETVGNTFESRENIELCLRQVNNEDSQEIYSFLTDLKIPNPQISSTWLSTRLNSPIATRLGVWVTNKLVGYISWSFTLHNQTIVTHMAVNKGLDAAPDVARILLTAVIDSLNKKTKATRINLEIPAASPTIRDIAINLGFRGNPGLSGLYKVVLNSVITTRNWASQRQQLESNSGIRLPNQIPNFDNPDQRIEVIGSDGEKRFITLYDLESLLAPTLFCLPNRPAIITPIRKKYAEPLLGHSLQTSLLPATRASIFQDRHYICAAKNLRHFNRGTLMFFYESSRDNGCSALIAMARVRQAYLKNSNELEIDDLEHSVLNRSTIKSLGTTKLKTVAVFDNIFLLPQNVQLKTLQKIGCGTATSLLTSNPITVAQTDAILQEAFCNE